MPTYAYRCKDGHLSEQWLSIHDDGTGHLRRCETCKGPVSLSIETVNTYAVGGHGAHTAISDATDREWSRDMGAYSRFKKEGLQPRTITGCDQLESTAVGRWHVETGQPHRDEVIADKTETARAIMRGHA